MKNYLLFGILFLFASCATIIAHKQNHHIYWINSAKVPCEGVGNVQCFKVQKGEQIDSENWKYFHSVIDGFKYQPGYIYKIIVHEEQISKVEVPADGSSIKYTLVKIIEKNQDVRLRINDIWVLEVIEGESIQQKETNSKQQIPQIEFNVSEMKVIGNDGCNNFFGSIKKLDEKDLVLGPVAGTRMFCTDTDIPDKFNAAISRVAKYKIDNMKLVLIDNLGNELLLFKKVD
jgi:heat shock protein HslJ